MNRVRVANRNEAVLVGLSKAPVTEARARKLVRTKINRLIHIPNNTSDRSLFNLSVQTNGADGFKLALCLISSGLEGVDARIVN